MSDQFRNTPLSELLITETVRLIEEGRPRGDSLAMQHAFEQRQGAQERLVRRALLISCDLKLQDELQRWASLVRYTTLALMLLAVIVGAGIASSVTSPYRFINAPYALILALGPHLLALLLWLLTLWRPALSQDTSVGSMLLRLAARLPLRRGPYFWTVLHASVALYARKGLLPWISGIASHVFWIIVLLTVLTALGLAFSFQAYRLSWETTILPAEFFVGFVQLSGWLPHQLGFPLPDTDMLQNQAAPDGDHRTWAWWLIGCISVYGLLPRLALALLSALVWQYRKRTLRLDLSHPYYMSLLARFNEMEPSIVVEREKKAFSVTASLNRQPMPGEPASLGLIGFELPDDLAWPPGPIQARAGLVERIAGSNQERQAVLRKLQQQPPYYLIIACHLPSSPDRGTAAFLREAAAHAVHCALLLLPAGSPASASATDKAQRWQDWLRDSGLEGITCLTSPEQAKTWQEESHA